MSFTPMECPTIIAEIGCNHQGNPALAERMVRTLGDIAAKHRVQVAVKSQKRCVDAMPQHIKLSPHPHPWNAYGRTYGEHRRALELPLSEHIRLANIARELGMEYCLSVWDKVSLDEVCKSELVENMPWIKVPSALNEDVRLLGAIRDNWPSAVHVSCGMIQLDALDASVNTFSACPERLTLYACTSGYPVEFRDVFLAEIPHLRQRYVDAGRCRDIGFSGHHLGIAIDIGALAVGAKYIERHFTLDRTLKGTDHAASLEPAGFDKLCRDARALWQAWRLKPAERLTPVERETSKKLKEWDWEASE